MILESTFRPPWWLRNPHLQTIVASTLRPRPSVALRREQLALPDGEVLDLDWTAAPPRAPLVLVLHGLEGSSRSNYAAGILGALSRRGFNAVLMHFRGCGGTPTRLARRYHAGETGDMAFVVETLRGRHPGTPLGAVGYSLGGNALLKWLGETGCHNPLTAAAAVSVPFRLDDAARRIDRGASRIYQRYLLRKLMASLERQRGGNASDGRPRPASLREFDDRYTAPLHGFAGVEDYYARSSSRPFLKSIEVPTLVLHALDDPFMFPATVPGEEELSPAVQLELSRHGGHVGFISADASRRFWLEERLPTWFEARLTPS